jgi:carboxylate-amine ligase
MTFGSHFAVGVEEELLLVEPCAPWNLVPAAADVLRRMGPAAASAGHEAYAAEVELRTPVCDAAGDAARSIAGGRRALADAGATPLAAGLHPTAEFGDAELVAEPRYQRVRDDMRGLIERTPECALHVHVGMPDPETAIRVLNGLRGWLPLLQALSANSPWWFGRDSGMASARWAMVRAYPGRGIPPVFRDYAHYEETVVSAQAAGGFEDYTHLWWDVRPHPRHGTVEVREMDVQTSVDALAGIAALIVGLAHREAEAPRARHPSGEAIGWSSFRAARDGLAAEVLDGEGAVRPATAVVSELIDQLRDGENLAPLERLVQAGGGAAVQRRAAARGGAGELLSDLVARTHAVT